MSAKSKTALILLSVLIIGITIGALANATFRKQREKQFSRMPPDERMFSFMERVIKPTPEQKQDFDQIISKRSEQLRKLHEAHQNRVMALYDSMRAELQSVLTQEQKERFEEQIVRGSHRIAESRIAHLTRALNLDEKQQKRIQEIFEEYRPGPRNSRRLQRRSWEERQQVFTRRFQKMNEEIEAVLTPEQKEKFRELRRQRHPSFDRPPPFQRPQRRPNHDRRF